MPADIKEELDLYNRLQVEDPAAAQKLLAEFLAAPEPVAALAKKIEWEGDQMNFITETLEQHRDVRWTLLFLHEPAWEQPSGSFKAIQEMPKDRNHKFFAGHLHYYDYAKIDGYEHITMGPVGGPPSTRKDPVT